MRASRFRDTISRPRSLVTFAAALALTVIGASCGSNAQPPSASGTGSPTSTPTTTASTPTTPASTVKPKPPTSPASSRPSASAKPSANATAPGSSVVLDLKCARRGVDVQGITFQTRPGGPVGFNTEYSDGSSSVDGKSNYNAGYGGAFADSKGYWRMTWTVPANAPTGVATVKAVTQDKFDFELKYTVMSQDGSCPA